MRPQDGEAILLDHAAIFASHGLPDDDREWTLAGRVKRCAEPGAVSVWVCLECYRTNRSLTLSCGCGAAKPRVVIEMEERAAELELITRASLDDNTLILLWRKASAARGRLTSGRHGQPPSVTSGRWRRARSGPAAPSTCVLRTNAACIPWWHGRRLRQ
jgi:hypothetical protein